MKDHLNIDYNKHIWEGWTVQDFVDDLDLFFPVEIEMGEKVSLLKTREEVKKWCMDNQPYYKKYIPEVVQHFVNMYNINS